MVYLAGNERVPGEIPDRVVTAFSRVSLVGLESLAPSSSGLGRRPLKAVTPVRIRSGLPQPHSPTLRGGHRCLRACPAARASGHRFNGHALTDTALTDTALMDTALMDTAQVDAQGGQALEEQVHANRGEQDAQQARQYLQGRRVRAPYQRREYQGGDEV